MAGLGRRRPGARPGVAAGGGLRPGVAAGGGLRPGLVAAMDRASLFGSAQRGREFREREGVD